MNELIKRIELQIQNAKAEDTLDESKLSEVENSYNQGWQSGATWVLEELKKAINE